MTLEDLANYLKMHTDPQIYPEINLCPVGDKNIIEVKVKENEEKPVFFKNHAFKRVGTRKHPSGANQLLARAKHWMVPIR